MHLHGGHLGFCYFHFGLIKVIHVEIDVYICTTEGPANTKHLHNIYTTSAQRLRRWPTLYKCYTNVLCLLGGIFDSATYDCLFLILVSEVTPEIEQRTTSGFYYDDVQAPLQTHQEYEGDYDLPDPESPRQSVRSQSPAPVPIPVPTRVVTAHTDNNTNMQPPEVLYITTLTCNLLRYYI